MKTMNNILETRKKKLTLILSSSIIGLTFLVMFVFLGFKYFSWEQAHKKSLTLTQKEIIIKKEEILWFLEKKQQEQEQSFEQSQEEQEIEKILESIETLWNNPDASIESNPYLTGKQSLNFEPVQSEFPFFSKQVALFETSGKLLFHNEVPFSKISEETLKSAPETLGKIGDFMVLRQQLTADIFIVALEEIEYPLSQFWKDILYFSLILIVVWIFLNILSYFIVSKILQPVEENMQEMEYFIDNAGHELKTPLAVIQSSGNLMKEIKQYDSQLLDEIMSETQKAGELISALRSLSQMSKKTQTESCNLADIVTEIWKEYLPKMREKHISLTLKGQNLEVLGNHGHLKILLSNLIGNAIKYNKEHGKILVTLAVNTLSIEDTGIGIPKKEQKKIWSRFYRVKEHRNLEEGFGLGLAMVQKICEMYRYTYHLESTPNVGTKITLTFPKK